MGKPGKIVRLGIKEERSLNLRSWSPQRFIGNDITNGRPQRRVSAVGVRNSVGVSDPEQEPLRNN